MNNITLPKITFFIGFILLTNSINNKASLYYNAFLNFNFFLIDFFYSIVFFGITLLLLSIGITLDLKNVNNKTYLKKENKNFYFYFNREEINLY